MTVCQSFSLRCTSVSKRLSDRRVMIYLYFHSPQSKPKFNKGMLIWQECAQHGQHFTSQQAKKEKKKKIESADDM